MGCKAQNKTGANIPAEIDPVFKGLRHFGIVSKILNKLNGLQGTEY